MQFLEYLRPKFQEINKHSKNMLISNDPEKSEYFRFEIKCFGELLIPRINNYVSSEDGMIWINADLSKSSKH